MRPASGETRYQGRYSAMPALRLKLSACALSRLCSASVWYSAMWAAPTSKGRSSSRSRVLLLWTFFCRRDSSCMSKGSSQAVAAQKRSLHGRELALLCVLLCPWPQAGMACSFQANTGSLTRRCLTSDMQAGTPARPRAGEGGRGWVAKGQRWARA